MRTALMFIPVWIAVNAVVFGVLVCRATLRERRRQAEIAMLLRPPVASPARLPANRSQRPMLRDLAFGQDLVAPAADAD